MNQFTAKLHKSLVLTEEDQWGHGQVRQGWDLLDAVEMYMELKHALYIPLVRPDKSAVPNTCF